MKIVVRETNWIGDAVMTIPALRELRRLFPDAHIALHTRAWAEGIFRDADFLDEIIAYKPAASAAKDAWTQGRELRKHRFDLAVLFPNSFESALAAKLGKIPKRFGYARDGRSVLLTNPVSVPEWKNSRHEVFYYLNLVSQVEKALLSSETVRLGEPSIDLPVSTERRRQARDLLMSMGIDPTQRTIAFGAGSTNSMAKRWPAENYALLNDRLQNELGIKVILVGSANENDVSTRIAAITKNKPLILTGKTDLADAVAILAECDLMVSNDMGLAHIAPAVGTQTIVLFGPTNPKTTAPFSPLAGIVNKEVECSPCMLRECPIDHRCMTRITVDEIFERIQAILTQIDRENVG